MWSVLKGPSSTLQIHEVVLFRKLDQLDCLQLPLKDPFKNTFLLNKTFRNFKHREFFQRNYHVFHGEAYFPFKNLKLLKLTITIVNWKCQLFPQEKKERIF